MHKEFSQVIQAISEKQGEVTPDQIMASFKAAYLDQKTPFHFRKLKVDDFSGDLEVETEFDTKVYVTYAYNGVEDTFEAVGNGPIDAVKRGLQEITGIRTKVLDFEQHALQSGSDSHAAAYIYLLNSDTGAVAYGVGVSSNITRASVRAVFSAMNRLGVG
jgi:2-isopropylmalate synthase